MIVGGRFTPTGIFNKKNVFIFLFFLFFLFIKKHIFMKSGRLTRPPPITVLQKLSALM
jgi:hypothetical protein